MQKNSGNFSMQDAMQLASSPAGQQLMELLKRSDPEALRTAMEQASGGDLSKAKQALAPLLASDEIKKLLQQLGG